MPFSVNNTWFNGSCKLTTFEIDELLGTKLRALYQRKKGRDLFDLYWALKNRDVDIDKLLHCFREYMKFVVKKVPTRKQFTINMKEKENDNEFNGDIQLLLRPGIAYNSQQAFDLVINEIVEKI